MRKAQLFFSLEEHIRWKLDAELEKRVHAEATPERSKSGQGEDLVHSLEHQFQEQLQDEIRNIE